MIVGGRLIGAGEPPYVIAEIGVNHDGLIDKARALVDAAADAGADAVKVQWFEARRLAGRGAALAAYQARGGARDAYEMLAALELDARQIAALAGRAHDRGLHAIATLFSPEHAAEIDGARLDAIKTASPDVVHRPLLEAIMSTGRPMLVSCGAATLDEVRRAAAWLGGHPHVLMQCVSAYPAPDDRAAIAGLRAMAAVSPRALGYSDHTTATDTGALAVAAGACVLEKHLTLDRRDPGPDHAASIEPDELARYVALARRAHAMLGPVEKTVLDVEREVRAVSRQSIVAARDLAAGTVLRADDLTTRRPGTGLEPWRLAGTIGRRLARPVESGAPLREEDLE